MASKPKAEPKAKGPTLEDIVLLLAKGQTSAAHDAAEAYEAAK